MRNINMKNEMYMAECPKCGLTYKGNAKYFRFDLKEKCFDGITELVNYRIAGTTFDADAYAVAQKMVDDAIKTIAENNRKYLEENVWSKTNE
jgi:hypothetical protein